MKFETLNTEPGVTFGTTVAGRTFYYYSDSDIVKELKHDRNRMGQPTHVHVNITNPSHVKEIKEAMEQYEG